VRTSKYDTNTRILYKLTAVKGHPMYYGRITRKHWHSAHYNEDSNSDYWTYTVITTGMPDVNIFEDQVVEVTGE